MPRPNRHSRLTQSDSATLLAIVAGVTWPVVVIARSAVWSPFAVDVIASTSVPGLLALAAAIALARDALAARDVSIGLRAIRTVWPLAATALLAAGLSLVDGTAFPDPAGVGLLGPPGTPKWGSLLSLVVVGGVTVVPRRLTARLPRELLLVAAAGTMLLTAMVHASLSGAVLVSAASAAVMVLLLQSPVEAPDRQPVLRRGAAVGLIALSPGCLHMFAAHAPDRAYVADGRVRVLGPVIPLLTWVMLLAAALGIVAAASARIVGQLRRVRRPIALVRTLSFQQWFVLILAGSFILRIAALFTINDARRDAGDPYYYHVTANLLAHGRGFWDPVAWVDLGAQLPGAKHGPVLPAALALWSRLGGTGYLDHQIASIVLGLPQVAAVMLLARLLAGRRAAVLAGLLAAVYPNIWVSDGILFSEGLMAGFTTFATLVAYRWRGQPTMRSMALLGALVGAAALTRGEAVLLIPLLLVPLALSARALTRRDRWRHAVVGAGSFAAVLAPWAVYNAGRFEHFVPLSTNSNEVLFFANCDDTYSGPLLGFWSFDCIKRYQAEHGEPEGDESQVSEFYRDRAIEYAKDNSDRLPAVVAARVGRQWELFRPRQAITFAWLERRPRQALRVGLGMYYAMIALAIPATLALRRRRVAVWPLWVHALSVTITAAYAYGTLRFRAPFEPLLCVLAAIGAIEVAGWIRMRLPAARRSNVASDASAPTAGG